MNLHTRLFDAYAYSGCASFPSGSACGGVHLHVGDVTIGLLPTGWEKRWSPRVNLRWWQRPLRLRFMACDHHRGRWTLLGADIAGKRLRLSLPGSPRVLFSRRIGRLVIGAVHPSFLLYFRASSNEHLRWYVKGLALEIAWLKTQPA